MMMDSENVCGMVKINKIRMPMGLKYYLIIDLVMNNVFIKKLQWFFTKLYIILNNKELVKFDINSIL